MRIVVFEVNDRDSYIFYLLCLLAANRGQVLTYDQIYRKVWGEDAYGDESNAIGCHM